MSLEREERRKQIWFRVGLLSSRTQRGSATSRRSKRGAAMEAEYPELQCRLIFRCLSASALPAVGSDCRDGTCCVTGGHRDSRCRETESIAYPCRIRSVLTMEWSSLELVDPMTSSGPPRKGNYQAMLSGQRRRWSGGQMISTGQHWTADG